MNNTNNEPIHTEQSEESGKNTSYLKVILIFCVVVAVLITGFYYLLDKFF
jgi:hypothetical protein